MRIALEWLGLFTVTAFLAVLATAGLAYVADELNWCCVHGWALVHGSGAIVLLLFGLVFYHAVVSVGLRLHLVRPFNQFGLWPHVSYIGGALGTLFLTEQFMWVGLFGGLVAAGLWLKGRPVQPMGIAVVGISVSLLNVANWLYLKWAFSSLGAS
jgi:hypothetical protein